MTAPTSLAETLAAHVEFRISRVLVPASAWRATCLGCEFYSDHDVWDDASAAGREHLAEAARAWLVARLNEHGPEVIDSHQFRMLRHGWGCSCGGDYLAAHAAHVVAALTEVLTDD